MNIVPPASDTSAAATLSELLRVLADPKATEAKLKELRDAQARLEGATKEMLTAKATNDEALQKANKALDERLASEKRAETLLKDFEDRQARLMRAEADAAAKAKALASRELSLAAAEKTFSGRVSKSDRDLSTRSAAATRLMEEAQALKSEYERKTAALEKALA